MTKISNPFSTGGGGYNFEDKVHAVFVSTLLCQGNIPGLTPGRIVKIILQGIYAGFQTDDLILFNIDNTGNEQKLISQIKHKLSFTLSDQIFEKVIRDAWQDFSNSALFNKGKDRLCLITSPASKEGIEDIKILLEWINYCSDWKEFESKVKTIGFSSNEKRNKFSIICELLSRAKGSALSGEELFAFFKSWQLLNYDLDNSNSTHRSLIINMLNLARPFNTEKKGEEAWQSILEFVKDANQSAGTITSYTIPVTIKDYFSSSINISESDGITRLKDHSKLLIQQVKDSIGTVHLERTESLLKLSEIIENNNLVIVQGTAGIGKSALIKNIINNRNDILYFYFRIEDFNSPNLESVLTGLGVQERLQDLSARFALLNNKWIIIESLEKLFELENSYAFQDLLAFIKIDPTWKLIITCRTHSVQTFFYNVFKPLMANPSLYECPMLTENEIDHLKNKIPELFNILSNNRLRKLIRNLYYLELAFFYSFEKHTVSNESDFLNFLWKQVIGKESENINGLPDKRRITFEKIALKRAKTMTLGVDIADYDLEAVNKLIKDDLIIRYEDDLIAPSHDVLEDLALIHFIDREYRNNGNEMSVFIKNIGNEPAMHRSFRLWIMKHISDESSSNFSKFIESLLNQKDLDIYWKDEVMSAILISDDPLSFFNKHEELLIENDGIILRRFIFILCLSCKIPDKQLIDSFKLSKKTSELLYSSFLIPFGNGWSALLNFINSRINSFNDTFIDDFVQLLKEWLLLIRIDQSLPNESKAASEIALNLLKKYKDNIIDNQQAEAIVKVLIYLYPVIRSKIRKLIMQDIFYNEKRNKRNRSDWANIFVEQVLATLPNVQFLCKYHPQLVIRIAWQYWKMEENREKYLYCDIDADFGFQEFIGRNIECFPPSGLQGPFDSLLKYHPKIGISFILELCNYSAIKYSNSNHGKSECEYVYLEMNDGHKIKQICCERLWMAYRGTSVTPSILQSALMALENYLIKKIEDGKSISADLKILLSKSNSVLTSGLVAGLATGYWQLLGKAILPIVRTREFYNLDYLRLINEQSSNPLRFSLTMYNDVIKELFYNERMKSNNRIWRKIPLENIIPNLLLGDMKEEVSDIIDSFYKKLPPISQQNDGDKQWRLILNRMDIRKYHAEVSDKTKCILKIPDPEADLHDYVNKSLQHENFITPFYKLNTWAKRVFDGENVIDSYAHYTEAISDAKKIQKLSQESPSNEYVMLFKGGVTHTAAICVRDHWSELTYEDKLWSLSVVEEVISLESQNNHALEDAIMFNESYAAAFIIPQLYVYFINSDNEKKLKNLIAIAVTHESESIRQAVCQGINKYLWNYVPDFAQSCLWGSIEYSFLREKLLNTNYIPQRIKEINLHQEKILILREWPDPLKLDYLEC
jgi:hypothetical protein